VILYCGTRFDDLYLCELEAGHKGAHALRPRCGYCGDPLRDGETSYHLNNVCDRQAQEETLALEVAATVRRIEFVDSATTAVVGDEPINDYYVDALLDAVDEMVGIWRGSDRETAQLEAVELLMLEPGWPTMRVTVNYGGSVTVRGTWGSSEVEQETWAGMLAERLFEMLGGQL
jgi:hypothetical protein